MYPAFVDLNSFTVNGVNGITLLGENTGDKFGWAAAFGNVFNTSQPGFVIGAPLYNSFYGRGYVASLPYKISPPASGIIPMSLASNYFTHFLTLYSQISDDEICASVNIVDVDQDGVLDIFCGSQGSSAYGSAYWIRGGTWLRSLTTFDVGTLNGINGCRFLNFFSSADNCGWATKIVRNMTGNGNNGFMIGCPGAFSYTGAVIVIPYTANFCPGGTLTAANLNGVTATYYKGLTVGSWLGYGLDAVSLRSGGTHDLVMGSKSSATYVKFSGPSVMGTPPILVTSVDRVFSGISGDSSGWFVTNLGNIFKDGCDTTMIGASTSSTLGQTNAGRNDIIRCGSAFPNVNMSLPSALNGFSVYDIVANEALGNGGYGLSDVNGDQNPDFTMTTQASRFGRTNCGSVALCFGQSTVFSGSNNTLIYQNLLDGKTCSEFIGASANEFLGNPNSAVSTNFWNNDTIADWGVGSYSYNSQVGLFRIIFGDAEPKLTSSPYISNLPQCSSTVLTINNFNATDQNDPQANFIYNINVSNGNATLGSNPAQIFNATYAQLANNQININRNCNNSPFTVNIGVKVVQQNVTKLGFLPPQPLTINFRPNVSFPLLNQGGNVRLTPANLDAICDSNCGTTPSAFKFKVSGPGAFTALYPNLNTPVSTVSKLDLLATAPAGVYLTSDGSNIQPLLDVTAMDNSTSLISTVLAQPVPFRSIPALQNKSLFSVYNRTVPVISNQLFASQKYNLTDVSNLIMSADCQGGGFYSYAQQSFISTLQNPNISHSDIGFSTGVNGAPKCNITVTDGVLSSTTPLNFTYYPGPKFGNNIFNLRINQGVTNQSLSLNFNFQNFLNGINYVLDLFNPQHISYTCYDSFGNAEPVCTIDDIQQGRLVQSHDGSLSALGNGVATITDTTYGLSDQATLIYTLVKRPQPVNATFPTLYQVGAGSSIRITTDMLDSLCDAPCSTNSSSLQYTFNIQNGFITDQFSNHLNQGTKQDVLNGNLYLSSAGINQKPILSYYLTDLANSILPYNPLMSGPFSANIPSYIDVPIPYFLTWNMLEGVQFNLTRSIVNGTSNYIPNSGDLVLDFNSTSIQNLQIFNYQTGPTTTLSLGDIGANKGALIGGPGLPVAQARICYSTQCSPYQAIPVSAGSFGFAPRLYGVATKLGEGQLLPFNLNSVNYTNLNSDSVSTTLSNYLLIPSGNQYLNFVSANSQNILLTNFSLGNASAGSVNMQNAGQPSSSTFVLFDISRGLSSAAVQGIFKFAYIPRSTKNAFVVKQTNSAGNSLSFGTESLAVNETRIPVNNVDVQFTIQAPCLVDSSQNPGNSLVPYSDLSNRYTRITTDGSSTACRFNVTFIDRSNNNISFSFVANITYFDQPVLRMSNVWNMFENVLFNLSLPLLNGTSNSIANVGDLTILFQTGLQNLQLINYLMGSVAAYKLSDISSGNAALIGGPGLPSAAVAVCNPGLCSPYQAIPVSADSFGFAPRLNSVNFTLAEGQRQLLSLAAINYSNLNAGDSATLTLANYLATVSTKQYIEFYLAGTNTVLSSFTLADVKNNLVEVANGGQASSYQMTLTDTSRNLPFGLSSSALVVQPRFGYKPSVVTNYFAVNQTNSASMRAYFGTEALAISSLSSPVSGVNVLFSPVPACSIDSSQNPGNALIPYSAVQSRFTRITVNDPSSPTPCQFNFTLIDPNYNNVTYGPITAVVKFGDIPVPIANFIACAQGTSQTLLLSNFNARDNANNPAGIFVEWDSLNNAALTTSVSGSSVPTARFSLTDEAANKISFTPNNGAAAPNGRMRFIGNSGLPTQWIIISQAQGTLSFIVLHPAPTLVLSLIAPYRGQAYPISSVQIGVLNNDPFVNIDDIIIKINSIQYAWFQNKSLPLSINNAISQYIYKDSYPPSAYELVPDGSKNPPVVSLLAVTPPPYNIPNLGGATSLPVILQGSDIVPTITNNQIDLARDEEVLITEEMLSGISGFPNDNNPGASEWNFVCQDAVLETNSTGIVTAVNDNTFKSLNITQRNIRLKASNTNYKPACSAILTNTDPQSTASQQTVVTFTEIYNQPTITAHTLPIQLGLTSYPILSSYIAAQDDPGNVGGKLYPLTQPSQMTFNISGMRGASLPNVYDASNYAEIPASVLYTLSLTNVDEENAGFYVSACNLAGRCSAPIAAKFQFTPALSTNSSDSLSTNTIIGIVLAPLGFIGTAVGYYCYKKRKNEAYEQKRALQKGTKSVIHLDLCNRFSSTFNITLRIVRANFSDNLIAEEFQTGLSKILVQLQKINMRARDKDLNEEERILLSGTIINEIKRLLPESGCSDSISLQFGCKREMSPDFLHENASKIAEAVKKALPDFQIENLGSAMREGSKRSLLPLEQAANVSDVNLASPTSTGPLLLSSAGTAAAGRGLQPDNKSDEPSAEISRASNQSAHSGDGLISRRSQSPTGVLLFSAGAANTAAVPDGDATIVELTTMGTAVPDARGSRSHTPPPLSGAPSITSTPPSPPADAPPPPPMFSNL